MAANVQHDATLRRKAGQTAAALFKDVQPSTAAREDDE